MGKRKCVICSRYIEEDEKTIPYKNRLAHESCFNSAMKIAVRKNGAQKETKAKTKKRISPKVVGECVSEEESQERKELFKYIENLFGSKPNAKIYSQIKTFKRDYPYFTYTGMEQSLRYFYEIKENEIIDDSVGIIPHVYDRAVSYFKKLKEVYAHNASQNVDLLYDKKKIKITPPKIEKEEDPEWTGGGYDW